MYIKKKETLHFNIMHHCTYIALEKIYIIAYINILYIILCKKKKKKVSEK